jgi:hypothetical protein
MVIVVLSLGAMGFAAPSTDEELRRSLDAKSGDDYDRELLGDAKTAKPAAPADEAARLKERLRRELGSAAAKEEDGTSQDPLLNIAREMHQAQSLIEKNDASQGTQFLQRQIVSDLDKLIEQAKKSGRQPQPGEKPQGVTGRKPVGQPKLDPPGKPNKSGTKDPGELPAMQSNPNVKRTAKEGRPDPAVTRDLMKGIILGLDLPPREREQMLQLAPEEFLPKYEVQIEEYYRRLSEEPTKPRQP